MGPMGGAGIAGAGAGFGENHGFWCFGEAPPVSNNAKIMDFGVPGAGGGGGPNMVHPGPTWSQIFVVIRLITILEYAYFKSKLSWATRAPKSDNY